MDHRVYDHTSLLATVKTLFGLPEFLTRRDAQANILDDANFLGTPRPRDDTPSNLTALVPRHVPGASRSGKLSDLQQSLLALRTAVGTPGTPAEPQGP